MSNNRKPAIVAIGVFLLLMLSGGALLLSRSKPAVLTPGTVTSTPRPSTGAGTPLPPGTPVDKFGIDVQLKDARPELQRPEVVPAATGEPLSPEEMRPVLARLPALTPDPSEQTTFNLPKEVLPPPRPGQTVDEPFPAHEPGPTPEAAESGPLQVLRYAPEGEIPIAPFVSVTFNQPMVPVGTLEDLALKDVPLKVEPDLPGTWRWLGTKTLTFEYDSELVDRLPKATEYRITVPAGTQSATGGTLAEAVTWTFRTPPPKVVTSYPGDSPQGLDPLFFVTFDQRIDPAAVLKTIQVTAGRKDADLVLATQLEIDKDKTVSQLVKAAPEGRWLAFRARESFPRNTSVRITIGPGTPSAEGPLLTTDEQSFGFRTYAALKMVEHRCAWYDDRCRPLTPFEMHFTNPLDTGVFSEDMLHVEPEIPGMSVNIYGDTLEISGQTKGQTTYVVTLSSRLQDVFGQQLGKEVDVRFKVDKAQPFLMGSGQNFMTLDPTAAKPVFSVYAINYSKVSVKIYAVEPNDWPAYREALRAGLTPDKELVMPGRLVLDKTLSLDLPPDALSQVDIELNKYMRGKFGHFIVMVEPPPDMFKNRDDWWQRYSQTIITWVQVTQIGLDAYTDHSEMVAWTTDLKDGKPLKGISIQPNRGSAAVSSGEDGVARFPIPSGASYLVATQGDDQALLPSSTNYWGQDTWSILPVHDTLRWYVFDDRQMYRPGEEVHVKGWLRRVGEKQDGDVGLLGSDLQFIVYKVTDPQGNAIGEGQAQVNALGGFDFVYTVPQVTNLGSAAFQLNAMGSLNGLEGAQYYHQFQVQEFRRPEFEVNTRSESSGPYFTGDSATLAVEAKYYAGGGLPNADVTWQVSTSPGSYSPPNWPDFTFGSWQPWWFYYDDVYPPTGGGTQTKTFTGKTDGTGTHYLGLDFVLQGDPAQDPQPQSIVAQATVMDVNRQAWSSTTTLLVHPADEYIGLRTQRYFVGRGVPLKVDFIVTDLDGKAVAGRPVVITAGRLEWKLRDGQWSEEPADIQTCTLTSKSEPDTCTFDTSIGGSYQITAVVTDEAGRKNQSRITRWVSGGQRPPSRKVEQEKVTLIPDKENYRPGETAEVLVQSPFSPAEGLLTVSRSGILYTQRFKIEEDTVTLKIPIEAKHIPNLNIQVDLVGAAPRTDDQGNAIAGIPPRPAYASGELNLKIPPAERTLSLSVTPDEPAVEPGSQTVLTVVVKDAHGNPVPDAELAVVVVDESILALTDYKLGDPLSIYYADRPSYLSSTYGRASVVLADPEALARQAAENQNAAGPLLEAATGAPATQPPAATAAPTMTPGARDEAGARGGQGQPPIVVRSDFNPLATFAPSVRTGPDGQARVTVDLPDNLTRYRIMAVAVDTGGTEFGTGESNLTARLPLMVRPSAPRFLNFGDKFELPVILQNQTDAPMTVSVVARATNLELENSGMRVTIPANDRIEVRFPASTIMAGTAQIQIGAASGDYSDAATLQVPVYTPATTEAFATYGVVDQGAVAQPVLYPSGVFPQYGGLEVHTSSTALQALTDSVLYLTNYPYDSSDQMASRILAIASLRDVLTAFKADGLPSPAEMEASVDRDIQRLQGLQNDDGGFPYWRRGFESKPFNTVHVTHALIMAKQKGYDVPEAMLQNALNYLRDIEAHYPSWYSQQTRWTLSAYALNVRSLAGDRDTAKAERLLQTAGLDKLSMEAIGWLWPVTTDPEQRDAIRTYVNNHVVETAGAANFTTAYDDQTYLLLSSDRRTDAILLAAIMDDNPQSDLIPKVVNGLLAHRTRGRWSNIQENVFVLLALDRYFNTYEAETPDFVARLWLGNTYAGSSEFRGRTTDIHETFVPMTHVLSETSAAGGTQNLILSKDGAGRLYYRIGLRYAPTDLKLDPLDMGFVVQRRYEGVDNPDDVTQDSNGVWHIKAGARVRVRITMAVDNRRYHVALVDPLPAGLEIVNPALEVSQSIPEDPNSPDYRYGWWWWGTWYEHQNMRDDRAEAFTSLLWDGVYEYTYIARATTPGTFIVPPTKAEEMYSPEVFGRTGSDVVIVEVR